MEKDYVLLGAGFSRALNDAMPLLSDLARDVLERLGKPAEVLIPFDNNLEQWLSYLSVDQPWLRDEDNLRNRATFREASLAVKQCIDAAEERVVAEPMHAWAQRLIWEWCSASSVVATFNYDLLVERMTSGLGLTGAWSDIYGMPLAVRHPPGTNYMFATRRPPGPVLRLFKLHGSVNWSYGGLDAPVNDRVVLTHEHLWWAHPQATKSAAPPTGRDAPLYDDLVPLIVPPTGTKGHYYGNRSLRAQWRNAFSALRDSRSITIIGYSFPESDFAARQFLSTSRASCPITIVDHRSSVADVVAKLLPDATITGFFGEGALQSFVDATCGDYVQWAVAHGDQGLRPRLMVNGTVVELPADIGRFDPSLPSENPASPQAWLASEVERRWPGLQARQLRDRHTPADAEGVAWQGAYTGTSA